MAIGVDGRVGVLASGSSSPANISAYLTSIGFTTHAYWTAASGLAPNSDGSGGTVANNGAVGYWSPAYQTGFSGLLWTQTSSSLRPTYQATGADGVPAIRGNGTTLCINLNSTSALDSAHTILLSGIWPNEGRFLYSYHAQAHAIRGTVLQNDSSIDDGSIDYLRNQVWLRKAPNSGTSCRVKVACLGQSFPDGGFAPRLLASSANSNYSTGAIYAVAIVQGSLNSSQMAAALAYMAG